jgi:hypothetical protein
MPTPRFTAAGDEAAQALLQIRREVEATFRFTGG